MRSKGNSHFVTIYAIDFFALLLVIGIIGGGVTYLFANQSSPGQVAQVLGEEDGESENSGSGNSEDEEEDEDEEDEVEPTEAPEATEAPEPTHEAEPTVMEEDDEDEVDHEEDEDEEDEPGEEDEDDDDEEEDDDGEETVEITEHSDGSMTKVTTQIEDDGGTKVTTLTIDAEGNETKEVIETKDDGTEEISIKTKLVDGTEYEYKKEDGGDIKIEIKESVDGVESKVKYDSEEEEFRVEVEGSNSTLKIKFENDMFKLTHSGVDVLTNFPIEVDDETGQVTVVASAGDVILKQTPDEIVDKAVEDEGIDLVEDLELDEDDNSTLKYTLKGVKSEKLLGILDVEVPLILEYDPTSGSLLEKTQSLASLILDFISF